VRTNVGPSQLFSVSQIVKGKGLNVEKSSINQTKIRVLQSKISTGGGKDAQKSKSGRRNSTGGDGERPV